LEADNPLVRQLTFTDTEINKIVANRYINAFTPPKKQQAPKILKGKYAIHHLKLKADTIWYITIHHSCVCHDKMHKKHPLTFCKNGCGNNFHVECAIRWIRFQNKQSLKVSCPVLVG